MPQKHPQRDWLYLTQGLVDFNELNDSLISMQLYVALSWRSLSFACVIRRNTAMTKRAFFSGKKQDLLQV
jgi:hypothetical protein